MCRNLIVSAILCLTVVGCSSSEPRAAVHPAKGEVFCGGKPAAGAVVHLHPMQKDGQPPAYATVEEDGTFQLSTYRAKDGAAAGDYIVTIVWRDEYAVEDERDKLVGPDKLGDRYSRVEASPLRATIRAGKNELPRWEVE